MTRCICCPPASGCGGSCFIPATLELSLTVGAIVSGTLTPSEEAVFVSVVDGTYVLDYYDTFGFPPYLFEDSSGGFEKYIAVEVWNCNDSSGFLNPTVGIRARFCNTSSPYLTFNADTSAGLTLARADFPGSGPASRLDFCGGESVIVNDTANIRHRKIQCNTSSLATEAVYSLSVLLEG